MNSELTIQQVAQQTGLSSHTLRYYERIGLILEVDRAPNGHRRYRPEDLEWIAFLQQLKATGMPLAQMQEFAEFRRQGDGTAKQRREMLEAHRQTIGQQMQLLSDCLAVIDAKIERHRRREQNSTPPLAHHGPVKVTGIQCIIPPSALQCFNSTLLVQTQHPKISENYDIIATIKIG